MAEESSDVKILKDWERTILCEVDEKYDPDDDSSDEEAIAMRAKRAAERAEAEAEKEKAEANAKGVKKK